MSQESVEIEGSFADLGLDDPNQVQMPTRGVPVGDYNAFVANARFVKNRKDSNKRNVEFTYKIVQPGDKVHDMEMRETKPANANDEPIVKGFLTERLEQLGVSREDAKSLNIKSLIGLPILLRVYLPKDSEYTAVSKVKVDETRERVDYTPPVNSDPTGTSSPQQKAVNAAALDYA